jgi:hypothetical protein
VLTVKLMMLRDISFVGWQRGKGYHMPYSKQTTRPALVLLHDADHPEEKVLGSDVHRILIIPVFDVTGLGIVVPEYFPSWLLVPEQSIAVQLWTVTKS